MPRLAVDEWKDTYLVVSRKNHRQDIASLVLAGLAAGIATGFVVHFGCMAFTCDQSSAGKLVLLIISIIGAIIGILVYFLMPNHLPNQGRITGFVGLLLLIVVMEKHKDWGGWLAVFGPIAILAAVTADFSIHQRHVAAATQHTIELDTERPRPSVPVSPAKPAAPPSAPSKTPAPSIHVVPNDKERPKLIPRDQHPEPAKPSPAEKADEAAAEGESAAKNEVAAEGVRVVKEPPPPSPPTPPPPPGLKPATSESGKSEGEGDVIACTGAFIRATDQASKAQHAEVAEPAGRHAAPESATSGTDSQAGPKSQAKGGSS